MRPKNYWKVAMLTALIFGLLHTMVQGDDIKTGPRPGKDNPVRTGKYSVFGDDEIFLGFFDITNQKIDFISAAPTKADLSQWSMQSTIESAGTNRHTVAMGSGRLVNPVRDQTIVAFYLPNNGKVRVEMWDFPTNSNRVNYRDIDGVTTPSGGFVAIAVGDLDRLVGNDKYYHDEIVVARAVGAASQSYYYNIQVDILDYNLNTLASANVPAAQQAWDVAVVLGDFDGDGNQEFAVGQVTPYPYNQYQVDIFQFTRDQSGNPSLKKVSTYIGNQNSEVFNMASGDFDGDGKDDIVVAVQGTLDFLTVGNDFKLEKKQSYSTGLDPYNQSIVSGLFKFDLPNGYGMGRRQLAILIADDEDTYIRIYSIKNDWTVEQIGNYGYGSRLFAHLTAGNFVGHQGNNTSPVMDLAFTTYVPTPTLKVLGLRSGTLHEIYTWTGSAASGSSGVSGVIAYDRDGDSYLLGPPVHIVIENLLGLDYVIQEPPKHVDYLPTNPGDPQQDWRWDVINVSAIRDFNVEFVDSKNVSFSTTSKDTSNWSIGGSTELDVKATVEAGIGDIEKVSLSAESDTKIGYNYESSKSSYNSQYASRTTSFTSRTERDDFIAGKIQLKDIWRYPIVGFKTDDKKNYGFQEIILPGPKYTFKTGGLDNSDWYQPAHLNHNLLAYPSIRTQPFPPDLGSFTLPDGTVVNDTMNSMDIHSFSGTSQTIAVSWTQEAGSGREKSYSHKLSESEDIKTGTSAKGSFFEGSAEVEASFSVSFNNENSWGGSETEDSKNSESTGITINVPSGDSNKAYTFKSAVYVSSGGGQLKVAHAVDPLGSTAGQSWWRLQYGNAPDPGLNLPNRFISQQDGWELNEDNSRMEMRGFFLRKSKPNPVSGEYDLLSDPPIDGDIVNLCARVYNFALFNSTGFFDVLFESINIEQGGHEVGSRVYIGTARTSLDALQTTGGQSMKEVCVPWNTTGLSNAQYPFRFYVTVDPKDEVKNEIHEWKDVTGNKIIHGNNEGYWPWGSGVLVLKKQSQSVKPSVSMHIESLAIETPSGLKSKGPVRVFVGYPYRLRVHIVANEDHPHYHYTVFLDGPPENGKVIALRTNFGVIDGDNYVWANWTPQETGIRDIYVHFIEDLDDGTKGDAWDSLKVIVREEPISWRDEVIDRLMGVEE